jgi:hypothetical protein
MIFHTAAEKNYYNFFFKKWHRFLKEFNPTAKFSLRYVGDTNTCDVVEYCSTNNIMLDIDPISLNQIIEKYNCNEKDALGYYAISRWISLPLLDDHVCMTDVDLLQLNPLEFDLDAILNEKQFISISRKKENKTNKMMFLGFNKDFVKTVKDQSIIFLENNSLVWDLDTKILIWLILKNNFNWEEFIQLYCIDNLSDYNKDVKFAYFSSVNKKQIYQNEIDAKKARYILFLNKLMKVK